MRWILLDLSHEIKLKRLLNFLEKKLRNSTVGRERWCHIPHQKNLRQFAPKTKKTFTFSDTRLKPISQFLHWAINSSNLKLVIINGKATLQTSSKEPQLQNITQLIEDN